MSTILLEEGHTTQSTKGWKHSPDPEFSAKAARLRRLYAAAESGRLDGVLVCFDEHGPVTPTPKGGRGWWKRGRPGRIRANYRKPHGVAHFFGVYDVGADQLFGRWYFRKGADHVIATLKMIRARYAGQRIWVIQDNLSSHWTNDVRTTARQLCITLVPTPTYASWLNRIECHFGVMVKAVFAGSDYRDHDEIQERGVRLPAPPQCRGSPQPRRTPGRSTGSSPAPPPGSTAPPSRGLSRPIASLS